MCLLAVNIRNTTAERIERLKSTSFLWRGGTNQRTDRAAAFAKAIMLFWLKVAGLPSRGFGYTYNLHKASWDIGKVKNAVESGSDREAQQTRSQSAAAGVSTHDRGVGRE